MLSDGEYCMPFGFGGNRKEEQKEQPLNTHLTDGDDLEEINKIIEMFYPDEKVLLVARQSSIRPRGSHFTPNIIYATDRRIIIRDSVLSWKKGFAVIYNQVQ
jgi:hypothetical protein